MSSDPYLASGGAGAPGSWNRFAYVGGDPVNRFDPMGLASCVPDGVRGYLCLGDDDRLTGPGGGPLFTSSITVTDRAPVTGYYYGEVIPGNPGGPNAPGPSSGGSLQEQRESGFCTTPEGISCEEADRRRAALEDCLAAVQSTAEQKRQQWRDGRDTRMLNAIGNAMTMGAITGAVARAAGGTIAARLPGGIAGGVAGAFIGSVVDVTGTVLWMFWIEEAAQTGAWELGAVRPLTTAGDADCKSKYLPR